MRKTFIRPVLKLLLTPILLMALLTATHLNPFNANRFMFQQDTIAMDTLIAAPFLKANDSLSNHFTKPKPIVFNYSNLKKYIFDNLHYPPEALEKGIQGKVYVSFYIEPNGRVRNIKIVHPVHPLLDEETKRLIENMPHWRPFVHKGKAQQQFYTFPVIFELKD